MTDPARPRPPYHRAIALWADLGPAIQMKIGHLALEMVFADFVSGQNYAELDKLCDEATRDEACERSDRALTELHGFIPSLLLELFGFEPDEKHPDGRDPPWGWRDPAELDALAASAPQLAEKIEARKREHLALAAKRGAA